MKSPQLIGSIEPLSTRHDVSQSELLILTNEHRREMNSVAGDAKFLKHNRNVSNSSTRSEGDGMETPLRGEIPMPVLTHAQPKFVPKEPYKAAVGLMKRDHERNKLLKRVDELERQIDQLTEQYKIQVEVNSDLKKLLVASLGEDMQERVQFLTEDKQRLASEIAFYTQKLQKDISHIDELNIECDVWRTKYLATSLLVTELATVKAELGQRCDDFEKAVEASKLERAKITEDIFKTQLLLRETHRCLEPLSAAHKRHPSNLTECSQGVLHLAYQIANRFGVSEPSSNEVLDQTPSEKTCEVALNQYKALMQAITSRASVQFDENTDETTLRNIGVPTCFGCQRCKGPVVVV